MIWNLRKKCETNNNCKISKRTKHWVIKNQCQFHEIVKNETRRNAYKKRNCSKNRKNSNQTNQKNDKKSSFYICWIVAAHSWSRDRMKNDQRDIIDRARKKRKKKSRLEKWINEKENDDLEFVINKFDKENDCISFENQNNEIENVSHAKNARHENLHTNYSIDDKFNFENFFDDINDERVFQTLYS